MHDDTPAPAPAPSDHAPRDCRCCKSPGTVDVAATGASSRTWACSACGSRWMTSPTTAP